MYKITYFGTDGHPGHALESINYKITPEEYKFFITCDSDWFMNLMRKHRNEDHKCSYIMCKELTIYSLPYSVDDSRNGSHTVLFVSGEHTIEEMEGIILNNSFLRKQFDMTNRFK